MIINHNMSAVNAHRSLKFTNWSVDKSMSKLSSGLRITRAGDDASGLAVSEKMRAQIRGLRQAERNAEDGMSLVQTAEGYLHQTTELVQRLRELAIQAANGIYTKSDRQLIQMEVSQLVNEIDRVASQAEFNRRRLLFGDMSRGKGSMTFHVGANSEQRFKMNIEAMAAENLKVKSGGKAFSFSTPGQANAGIGVLDEALQLVTKQRANLGAMSNRLEMTAKSLMMAYENMQASESRIRDADMAEEMVSYTKNLILTETGASMLAQANVRPQTVLKLLNG